LMDIDNNFIRLKLRLYNLGKKYSVYLSIRVFICIINE
jgi:hypothetical protein